MSMTNVKPVTPLKPHTRDLGGFQVSRVLPGHPLQMVGPFIFFDHMGPAVFAPGQGVDVRPHPHIGLATVTYLFEGAIMHRDSLGSVQRIEPGAVNWMTAGDGIVHSERTPVEERTSGQRVHGIQSWVALPKKHEHVAPSFNHQPKTALPEFTLPGVKLRVIVGSAFGKQAPTPTFSPILYVVVEMEAQSRFDLPAEHQERGVYVVDGDVVVHGTPVPAKQLAVLPEGEVAIIEASSPAQIMLIGGDKIDGERFIWWNFVASSRELVEEGKRRWREGRFGSVPGETEFIPLPDTH